MITLGPGPLPSGPLFDLGDWIQLVGIVPGIVFVIDYGILSLRRVDPEFRWYRSGIGTMFLALGLAFVAQAVVIGLTLTFGVNYPGRDWVRVIGYAVSTGAIFWMLIVYAIERQSPTSVLVPQQRRQREQERQEALAEFERTHPRRPVPRARRRNTKEKS